MDDPARRSALEIESSPAREGGAKPEAVWLLVILGTLAAIGVAWAACWFPVPLKTSGVMIFARAVVTVLLTAQAGFLVVMAVRRLSARDSVTAKKMFLQVGIGWVFFPCIALFYWERSPWMLVLTVIVAGILAMRVRGFFPPEPGSLRQESLTGAGGAPAFAELLVEREDWWRAPLISLCAQISLFPILAGKLLIAAVLLAACSGLLVWRWSGAQRLAGREDEWVAIRRLMVTMAIAILILWRALTPWIMQRMGAIEHAGNEGKRRASAQRTSPETGFVGIILLPPAQKKVKIAHVPERDATSAEKAAEPMVIPFDGPYWYFKAPFKEPGARAHVVHGRPTLVNIHSTDYFPLMMEAHQNLGTAIDLECCREIEMKITNADARPGRIGIELILTDSGSPVRSSVSLEEKTIVSSEAADIPINRKPVDEVLRFPIPQLPKVHKFDEITVVFLSARERARGAAKVSIQSFRLLPR